MYALDTDTTSLLFRGRNQPLNERVRATPRADLWVPAVVVEEQFRGRLAVLSRLNPTTSRDSALIPNACQDLVQTLTFLQQFQVMPYAEADEALFQSWSAATKRLGTQDCRIAVIAVNNGLIVVTRNARHFGQMPGVRYEDWTL